MKIKESIPADPGIPATLSLRIIWITGLLCMVTIWVFFHWSGSNNAMTDPWFTIKGKKEELQSIDALLLSSQEVELQSRKSFVNVALRLEWNSKLAGFSEDKRRKQIYNDILGKKLREVQKKREDDFSIKPVPK
jgi:hypothetical protein